VIHKEGDTNIYVQDMDTDNLPTRYSHIPSILQSPAVSHSSRLC